MYDKMETLGKSLIQHGKSNKRIYLMKLAKEDYPNIIKLLFEKAFKNKYSKIFVKIPGWALNKFQIAGYNIEAAIPGFFKGKDDGYFLSVFLENDRRNINEETSEIIAKNIDIAESKKDSSGNIELSDKFTIRELNKNDSANLSKLYEEVFDTYPFPIFDPEYIKQTMDENIIYFGIFDGDKLIAASSAETDKNNLNAEMTDFATLSSYRGHGFASVLLKKMEEEMYNRGFITLYTIARALSTGMNVTFAKMNYNFSGTLINNTNISGKIESMNVWYKRIK